MKVLICGDRNWKDEETIETFIKALPSDTIIMHGGCRGADMIAHAMAKKHGLEVLPPWLAMWEWYGRAAGPIRNSQMLVEGRPDRVVAFHDDINSSKGTANMLKQARRAGVPTEIRSSNFSPPTVG